ncbi:MAG: hypothetical protein EOR77_21640 [Mesorhizobium sp.]|uniref:hypothetical protein n=1 Tax=Mesorhizobium sp. TaxID=1871066 RepID=UPI000FE89999|nr:hypothetical protein [Mesorhizobium sp.]RWH86454.1 MAG: hypothetical protein EOQ87_26545 [Mesorhizobium sp.]RWM32278.1 MAG: hypothetical protein EOR77_21640 [Mesorhizobium sp.]TJV33778.1 MAG: hypothetical protein E5X87_10620 [Mesorhizobium sp.]
MASKPIVQRIALEGGDAIKDQLKALGDAGEKAFNQIKNAAVKADLDKFGASLSKVGSDLATVGRRFALLGAGLAAAAGGATVAVLGLAKSGGEAADQAGKAAQKTGLQVEAYGKLAFAANQADVSNEQFVSGMSRLNKAIAEAADETKKTGDVIDATGVKVTRFGGKTKDAAKQVDTAGNIFTKLGVKIKDANGKLRSNEDIVGDVAEAFSRMPDSALKSALAIELFGKAGAELLPFLNEGKAGLKALGDEATRLGIVFTKEQSAIGDDLGDALDEVSKAAAGTRLQLGLLFAPLVTELARGLRDIIVSNRDVILQLGDAAARVVAGIIGDLLHLLSGNDQNVKSPWIREWSAAIIQFGKDVKAVVETVVLPLFKAIRDGANLVADGINRIFGTDVTGGQLLIGAALLQLLGVFRLLVSSAGLVVSALRLIGTVVATLFSGGVIAAATTFFSTIVTGATTFLGFVAGLVSWPALIVAALVAAGVAVFVFWDDIVAAAQNALARIAEFFAAGNLARLFDGLVEAGRQAGALLVEAFRLAIEGIGVVLLGAAALVGGFVAGIVEAIGNLAGQLLPSWEAIAAAANAIWGRISNGAAAAFGLIAEGATALGGLLAPVWTAIVDAGSSVWTTISGAATSAFNGIASVASSVFQTVAETVGSLAGSLVDAFTGAVSEVAQAASDIASAIQRATEIAGDVQGAEALAEALVAPFRQAQTAIDQIMAGIRNVVQGGFGALVGIVNSLAGQIQAAISRIIAQLQQAAAQARALRAQAAGSSGGGSSQGFASGGYVRGPGGPKSDSILAWLSDTEFVMQASAVKKFGVGFMNAINNGFLPLKGLRGFSLGGLASGVNRSMQQLAIPRFASGGLAALPAAAASPSPTTGMVPLHFSFNTDEVFEAFTPSAVASRMRSAAVKSGLLSTGRKPTRK